MVSPSVEGKLFNVRQVSQLKVAFSMWGMSLNWMRPFQYGASPSAWGESPKWREHFQCGASHSSLARWLLGRYEVVGYIKLYLNWTLSRQNKLESFSGKKSVSNILCHSWWHSWKNHSSFFYLHVSFKCNKFSTSHGNHSIGWIYGFRYWVFVGN